MPDLEAVQGEEGTFRHRMPNGQFGLGPRMNRLNLAGLRSGSYGFSGPRESWPMFAHYGRREVAQDPSEVLRISGMYKRSRKESAPVATTSSVNFEAANRRITLSGREFVTTLYSASTTAVLNSQFTSTQALLRPTDFTLFSWLAGIAQKFEEFKFHKVQFVYEPQCPTTTPGSVALWFDEDPTHTAPANWNSMINTGANVHGAPWAKHVFVVPSHMFAGRRKYYTRSEFGDLAQQQANVPTVFTNFATATDPFEYYAGLYGFASQDCALPSPALSNGVPLGKIYLDYSLTLMTQNTDNWTQTSLVNKNQLSTQIADNSGSGAFFTFPTGSTALAITQGGAGDYYRNLLCSDPAKPTVVAYPAGLIASGCQYFNLVYNVTEAQCMWQARQGLEIVVDLGITLSGAITGDAATHGAFWVKIRPISGLVNGITDAYVLIGSYATQGSHVTGTNGTLLADVKVATFYPLYQLAAPGVGSLAAATSFVSAFQLKLQPGDLVSFGVGDTVNTDTVTQFTIGITPLTYGISS